MATVGILVTDAMAETQYNRTTIILNEMNKTNIENGR